MRFVPSGSPVAWFASMYGVGDPALWSSLPKALGIGGVRITDIIERDCSDLLTDPEGKLDETDAKLESYAEAGLFAILDLSYIRNALIRAGINPYIPAPETDRFIRRVVTGLATRRNTRTGVVYGEEPTLAYVAIGGEPEAWNWGEDHRRARGLEELLEWYERVAGYWRQCSDIPTSTGGIMHYGHQGSGLDFATLAALPCNQVPTVHIYDDADLAALPAAVQLAHGLGKPLVVEETGLDRGRYRDDTSRALAYGERLARIRHAAVDGIGLWNLGRGGGHDIDPYRDLGTVSAVRDVMRASTRDRG